MVKARAVDNTAELGDIHLPGVDKVIIYNFQNDAWYVNGNRTPYEGDKKFIIKAADIVPQLSGEQSRLSPGIYTRTLEGKWKDEYRIISNGEKKIISKIMRAKIAQAFIHNPEYENYISVDQVLGRIL
jgi:hypothetical protein